MSLTNITTDKLSCESKCNLSCFLSVDEGTKHVNVTFSTTCEAALFVNTV